VLLSLANVLFPLISFPYVAGILEPDGVGKVQFAFAYAQYFSIIAAVGIPFYGIKEIARLRNEPKELNKVFSELFLISLYAAIVATIIYLATIFSIPDFSKSLDLYLLSGLVIILGVFNLDWLFSGLEEFKLIAIRSIIIKSIALFGLFLVVKEAQDIIYYTAILVFSFTGNYLLNLFFVRRKVRLSIKGLNLRKHRVPLFFILLTTFATTVYSTLDSVILGFMTNEYQVGLYAAGVKLSKVAIPIVTGLSAVLLPKIAGAIQKNNLGEELNILKKSFAFIAFISIPISLGLFLFRENFILAFADESFISAKSSMSFLSFLPVFIGLGYFFGFQVLVPNNINRGLFISTLIGLLIFLVINILLTPQYGAKGTAIATLGTEIVVSLCYAFFAPKRILVSLPWKEVVICLAMSLVFFPVHWIIIQLNLSSMLELIIGIISCTVLYFTLQFVIFSNEFVAYGIEYIKKLTNRN
jgi:O-antigen/teichoic acid export membrane protein